MKLIPVTHGPLFETLALLSGELAHPKIGEGEGWEPEPPCASPLPGPSLAACSPWSSSQAAAKCALCQGGGCVWSLGEGAGDPLGQGHQLSWSFLPALWRAENFPGKERLALLGGRDVGEGAGSVPLRGRRQHNSPWGCHSLA